MNQTFETFESLQTSKFNECNLADVFLKNEKENEPLKSISETRNPNIFNTVFDENVSENFLRDPLTFEDDMFSFESLSFYDSCNMDRMTERYEDTSEDSTFMFDLTQELNTNTNSFVSKFEADFFLDKVLLSPNNNSRNIKESPTLSSKKKNHRKKLTELQKQAHNKIEKKYRINMNAKITGLQKLIPFSVFGNYDTDYRNDTTGQNFKLNKSTILEKATEYIVYLQKKNQKLEKESLLLKKEIIKLGGKIPIF